MSLAWLKNQIKDDWINHGEDWTKPGFRAIAVHRLGRWSQHRTMLMPIIFWRPLYRFLAKYVRNHYGIEIPITAIVGQGVIVEHQNGIVIHGACEIGDNCYIRQGVTIGMRHISEHAVAPKLGKSVDVGAGAKILGNITIGDNVSIGANAVVLQDVPSNCSAVGIPARIVPKRNPPACQPSAAFSP